MWALRSEIAFVTRSYGSLVTESLRFDRPLISPGVSGSESHRAKESPLPQQPRVAPGGDRSRRLQSLAEAS